MKHNLPFGEVVAGYEIPVLNEREIRAGAGILLMLTYTSLMFILFEGNFVMIKYVSSAFLLDLLIRVFVSPRYAPVLILARLIVRHQTPEYVGAHQKKFAWSIGIALSAIMFVLLVIVNAYSIITGLICLICLLFLFFETSFGICLGCLVYPLFFKRRIQHCAGEICDKRSRQAIQQVSLAQLIVLAVFIGVMFLAPRFVGKEFSAKPHDLFKPIASVKPS